MKDETGKTIEFYKWYKVIQEPTNPYNYQRHLMLFDKKGAKGKNYVLEIWTNSNHDGWQPSVSNLGEVFIATNALIESPNEILQVYERLQPLFVKKIFNPFAR